MNDILKLITEEGFTPAQVAQGLFEMDGDLLDEATQKPETFSDAATKFKRQADLAMGHFSDHATAHAAGQPEKSPIRNNGTYWSHIAKMHQISDKHPGMMDKFAAHPIMKAHEHVLATSGVKPKATNGSFIARKDHPVGSLGKKQVANATDLTDFHPAEHFNDWAAKQHGAYKQIPLDKNGKLSVPSAPSSGGNTAPTGGVPAGNSGAGAAGNHQVTPSEVVRPPSAQAREYASKDPYYKHPELNPKLPGGFSLQDVANDMEHPHNAVASQIMGMRNSILTQGALNAGQEQAASILDRKYGENSPHRAVINAAKAEHAATGGVSKLSAPAAPATTDDDKAAKAKDVATSAPPSPPINDPHAGHKTLDPVLPSGVRLSVAANTHPSPLVRSNLRGIVELRNKILRGEVTSLPDAHIDTLNSGVKGVMGPTGGADMLRSALDIAKNGDPEAGARKQAIARLAPKDAGRGLPALKLGAKPLTPAATAAADPHKGHATLDPVGVGGKRVSEMLTSHPSRIVREKLRDLVTKRDEALKGNPPSKADIQDLDTHLSKHLGKDAVQTLFANAAKEHESAGSSDPKSLENWWDSLGSEAMKSYSPKLSGKGAPSTLGPNGKLFGASPIHRARKMLGHKLRKWLHKTYPKDKLGTP